MELDSIGDSSLPVESELPHPPVELALRVWQVQEGHEAEEGVRFLLRDALRWRSLNFLVLLLGGLLHVPGLLPIELALIEIGLIVIGVIGVIRVVRVVKILGSVFPGSSVLLLLLLLDALLVLIVFLIELTEFLLTVESDSE